jgi:hypothetical protein
LYNNHLDLGKSTLLENVAYTKPDTIVYVDRLKASYKGKNGYIYFYQYKAKKDDINWKLATVGLVPEDPAQFEFEERTNNKGSIYDSPLLGKYGLGKYDFTSFSDTKIKADESINTQLKAALKKMLYSRRKSAKEFYEKKEDYDY